MVRTGITASKTAITTGMESLAAAGAYARTLRAALEYETQNGRNHAAHRRRHLSGHR